MSPKRDSGISVSGIVEDVQYEGEQERKLEAKGEHRLAWIWVEGWRARLRTSGDVVERERYKWRLHCKRDVIVCHRPVLVRRKVKRVTFMLN
jgi:hypothetical protein